MRSLTLTLNAGVILLVFVFCLPSFSQERREKGNLVIEGIPEIPDVILERMMQYQNTRSVSLHDWVPSKGGLLISTRFGETKQIHYVAEPGGARNQITFFKEPVRMATVCPDPQTKGFLFSKDTGGSEFYQVYYYDLDKGNSTLLTDGASRNGEMLWSNKGDRFIYFSTKRNGTDWDLYIMDPENPKSEIRILEQGGTWVPVDWSADDTRVLVQKYVSINESYYYMLEVATGLLEQIHPSEKKIFYGDATFSRDGKKVFLTSDEDNEFLNLREYDIDSKTFTFELKTIPWDVDELELSPDGGQLAFVVNESGVRKLYTMNTETKEYQKIDGIPIGQVYGLTYNSTGDQLAFVINTPKTPGDVFVMSIADGAITRWTYSEVGGLDTSSFVVPELIEFETFDQVDDGSRKIPAFWFKPEGAGPHPVVIYIHGGPEGQVIPYFSYTFQYWVRELGISVLAPNVRGSKGYGKSYLLLDNGMKREDSVKDIGALIDWIETQPTLDSTRVAVFGGSYGGYMVLASMIHYNDRLKCGVDVVGISNFVTFLENTKDYRRDLRRVEYGDERVPEMREFLTRISPTTHAEKITKPMFIVQGLNDPRVPATEAEQILEKIRKNGGIGWYLLARDEGHGFRKKSNRDYYTNSVVLFWQTFLLK